MQALLERLEVLDDAVVDDGHFAVAAKVRVGVDVARRAVGGPAGMADADAAGGGLRRQQGLQAVDPAGRLDDGQIAVRA